MIVKFFLFELKKLLKRKGNIAFIILLPVAVILAFSYILQSYMTQDVNFFENSKVIYSPETLRADDADFDTFADFISSDLNVKVIASNDDAERGKEAVEHQEAAAFIIRDTDGYSYYASRYMEQSSSKLLRGLFDDMMNKERSGDITDTELIAAERTSSAEYFVFAETGFIIMFLSLIFGLDIFTERENKTLRRFVISGTSLASYIISKMLLALAAGIVQIVTVNIISEFILKVSWSDNAFMIYLQYGMIALFSAAFGVFAGLVASNRTLIQQIVIVTASLFGFLGGSFAPISTLENMSVVSYCIKASPLYWANSSLIELNKGIVDSSYYISLTIWGLLAVVFTVLCFRAISNPKRLTALK